MGWHFFAREDEVAFVGDGPLDLFAFLELHALSDRGREVDVPLLAGLAFDELNFSWITHERNTSHMTRYIKTNLSGFI